MSLTFLKEKYPIIGWKNESIFQKITFGWNEFIDETQIYALDVSILPNQWKQEKDTIEFLIKGRESYKVDDIEIIDFSNVCYEFLAENYTLRNRGFSIDVLLNKFHPLAIIKNSSIPEKLYFTAAQKYRKNIEAGIQPIRWNSYYHQVENANDISTEYDLKYDSGEGVSGLKKFDKIEDKKNPNLHLFNHSILKYCFDGFIFSMHDKTISSPERKRFGSDTYEIVNINKWIESIVCEITEYLKNTNFSENRNFHNPIGFVVVVDKCEYSTSKEIKSTLGDVSHSKFIAPGGKGTVMMFGVTEKYRIKSNDFFETLKNDYFLKPSIYSEQSEWRLAVIPFWISSDGYMDYYISPEKETEFYAKALDSSSIKRLVKPNNIFDI